MSYESQALDFRLLSWEGNIDGWYYSDANGETHILSIRDNRLSSQTYSHTGERPVEFFVQVETPDGLAKNVVLSMPPPQGMTQAILMIKQGSNGQTVGLWLDDSPDVFPAGSMKIYNFFSNPAMLKLGGKNITLEPSHSHLYSIPQDRRAFPMKAAVKNMSGQWKLFSTLPIPVQKGSRMIVFIRETTSDERKQATPATLFTIYDRPHMVTAQ